jgi:hypothetical protein
VGFNLSGWWMRQKVGAQLRGGGGHVEHRRIANPYHAVSIEAGPRACAACKAVADKRYLSTAAPKLPIEGCTSAACRCRYVHHEDRRERQDRRVNFANPHAHTMSERRAGTGRRISD